MYWLTTLPSVLLMVIFMVVLMPIAIVYHSALIAWSVVNAVLQDHWTSAEVWSADRKFDREEKAKDADEETSLNDELDSRTEENRKRHDKHHFRSEESHPRWDSICSTCAAERDAVVHY